jgi:hypothetical protein
MFKEKKPLISDNLLEEFVEEINQQFGGPLLDLNEEQEENN